MASVTCAWCATAHEAGEELCENCGLPLPRHIGLASAGGTGAQPSSGSPVAPPSTSDLDDDDPFAAGPPVAAPAGGAVALVRPPDGRTVRLQQGDRLLVGRAPDSPLSRICGDNISSRHAEIYVDGRTVVVVDCGSTNGTFVEGHRLAPSVPRVLTRTAELQLASDPPLRLTIEVGGIQ